MDIVFESDEALLLKLQSGIYVKFKYSKKGDCESNVWANFFKIKDRDNKVIPHVMCAHCSKLFRFPKGRSVNNLRSHKCETLKRKADSDGNPTVKKFREIPDKLKEKALEGCVAFVTKDIRSFSTVNGVGFFEMARNFIEIGAELGTKKFDINEIVPHRTTVSRHVKLKQSAELKTIIKKITPIIQAGDCAATLDFWTEPHSQNNFLTFMIHYIDDAWTLNCHNLFTICFEKYDEAGVEVKKSAENIVSALREKFLQLGLPADAFEKFNYTTDQGSNLIKALKGNSRVNCAAHMLNLVLKNTFNDDSLQKSAPTVLSLLKKSKALVEYLKRSGKMLKLSRRVKQECSTRWNTKYDMLVILHEDYDEIDTVLTEDNEEDRLIGIDKQLVQKVIAMLKPFKDATEALVTDKNPSLQTVIFQKTKISDTLEKLLKDDRSKEMQYTIRRCLNVLNEKMVVNETHKIACFLWPEYKQMRYLQEDEREVVGTLVKKELEKISDKFRENDTSSTASSSSDSDSFEERFRDVPQATSSKNSSDQDSDSFDDRYRDVPNSQDPITLELIRYRSTIGSKGTLDWWRTNCYEFPLLSKVARRYLAWPASSASSERCFSVAGRVMEDRRTNVGSDSLDALLLLHSL